MRGKTVRRLAVLAAVGLLCHGAWAGTWNIGILAMRGEASTRSHWQPLAKTLSQQLPGETFHIQPLDLHQMQEAVNQGTVQFVITNPAQFVQLNSHAPLRWLASLRSTRDGKAVSNVIGSVTFDPYAIAASPRRMISSVRPSARLMLRRLAAIY